MPILWRYLLRSYFQVFLLCVCAFISILLVTRFQEIAQFASSGAPLLKVLLFTGYQIPYILPIAIPISCLIAAMLLLQKLSHTQELTAFRASGLSLGAIAYPLILAGICLTLVNFTIASEIGPRCRGLSKELIFEMTSVNPLLLFQKDTMVKLKDAYIDMKVLRAGKSAEDVVVIINNQSNQRLGIMAAKEFSLKGELLNGKEVAFISHFDTKRTEGFDHLVIENQATMCTKASNLSQFMQNAEWRLNYDYMPLRMMLAKKTLETKRFKLTRSDLEITRRMSIALAAFTFTLIGTAYGMEIGRNRTRKGIIWAIVLAASYMICFIIAKSMHRSIWIPCLLYLLPHPLIIILSLRSLKTRSRGIE